MDFKGLDLNLLYVLDALLSEKSVTRTGERIHLSQSATSGALGRLRVFFDDDLLVQIGHKLVPTPLAEELVKPVRDVLLQAETIMTMVPTFKPEATRRRFRVMGSDYVVTAIMPQVLERLQRVAPLATLDLLSNAESPIECLERGEVDLLIMPKQHISQVQPSEDLFEDRYSCVVWSGNTTVEDVITLDQYLAAGHVAVRLGRQQSPVFDEWVFERSGHKRRIEVVTMAFNTVPQLLIGTTRIATLPRRLAVRCAQYLPLRLLPPPIELPPLVESMQWHNYRTQDSAAAWFRRLMKEVAAETE
jgi:DNA-binding transcriptional LysR family regulator